MHAQSENDRQQCLFVHTARIESTQNLPEIAPAFIDALDTGTRVPGLLRDKRAGVGVGVYSHTPTKKHPHVLPHAATTLGADCACRRGALSLLHLAAQQRASSPASIVVRILHMSVAHKRRETRHSLPAPPNKTQHSFGMLTNVLAQSCTG